MNEKIRKLLVEAREQTKEGRHHAPLNVWTEKFAELIVTECIDVFQKDLPDPTSPDYQVGHLNDVINRVCNVAEHFGVEEK